MGRVALSCLLFFAAIVNSAAADRNERWIETILPGFLYSSSCWSTVDLHNLGARPVEVEVEGHRASGALAPLLGHREMTVRLAPGEQASYRLDIADETTDAWVKLREKIPSPALSPVVAVSGKIDCTAANELHTASREVAYPTRNPWFSEDLSELGHGGVILMINSTERTALVSACYSAGSSFTMPGSAQQPLCSTALNVQIPPFGSREFPVERGENTHFSLNTRGEAIVLQMLRVSDPSLRLYKVDSTITFGSEAAPSLNR